MIKYKIQLIITHFFLKFNRYLEKICRIFIRIGIIMKIYAVISEFNPFHNGHKHLIDTLKADGNSAVVAIMSGSFVERGDVAIINKYARAEAAIRSGCDLVLELPAPWCFAGAEFFALGGVSVANSLGVIDTLAFGSESGDIAALTECAHRLSSLEFSKALADARRGHPGANAATLRADTYKTLYGENTLLCGSNNLLALEYIQALSHLGSKIEPITVRRSGEDYNSAKLNGICSASAIREAISCGRDDFTDFMPAPSANILHHELCGGRLYDLSRLDTAVIARLRTCTSSELSDIMEMSGGIENRLCSLANEHTTIDALTSAVRDRHYSVSRIRRALIAAMLGVKMCDVEAQPMFTSVLAANEKGREVLSLARKRASMPILSTFSASKGVLPTARKQFDMHMKAERLAELCCESEAQKIGAVIL